MGEIGDDIERFRRRECHRHHLENVPSKEHEEALRICFGRASCKPSAASWGLNTFSPVVGRTFLTAGTWSGYLSEDGGFWILDFGLLIFGLLILDQNFIRRQPLQGDSRATPQMRERESRQMTTRKHPITQSGAASGGAATHQALRELNTNTRLGNPMRLQIIAFALYCRGNAFFGDFVLPFARLSHQHQHHHHHHQADISRRCAFYRRGRTPNCNSPPMAAGDRKRSWDSIPCTPEFVITDIRRAPMQYAVCSMQHAACSMQSSC
jgi:hypothetical protein